MGKYRFERSAGQPDGRAFVKVGITEDGHFCAEMSRYGQSFTHEVMAMLVQPFADLMAEAIAELPDPNTADRIVSSADEAILRAQRASSNRNG